MKMTMNQNWWKAFENMWLLRMRHMLIRIRCIEDVHSDNLQEISDMQRVKLHMTDFMSWHVKDSLIFCNDKNDSSTMKSVKQKLKPRRSKYSTKEKYQKWILDWESRKPHDSEVKSKENFMINKNYMKKILPELLKVINEHKAAERRAILQKNNDSSHEIKGLKDNSVKSFKRNNNIELLKHEHSAQSLDLNSLEEVWNILKQRVRRQEFEWHTLKKLKEIILEELNRIKLQ